MANASGLKMSPHEFHETIGDLLVRKNLKLEMHLPEFSIWKDRACDSFRSQTIALYSTANAAAKRYCQELCLKNL